MGWLEMGFEYGWFGEGKVGDMLVWCIERQQIGWDLDKRESECNLLNIVRFGVKMWVKWGNGVGNVGLLFSWWGIGFDFGCGVGVWVFIFGLVCIKTT